MSLPRRSPSHHPSGRRSRPPETHGNANHINIWITFPDQRKRKLWPSHFLKWPVLLLALVLGILLLVIHDPRCLDALRTIIELFKSVH